LIFAVLLFAEAAFFGPFRSSIAQAHPGLPSSSLRTPQHYVTGQFVVRSRRAGTLARPVFTNACGLSRFALLLLFQDSQFEIQASILFHCRPIRSARICLRIDKVGEFRNFWARRFYDLGKDFQFRFHFLCD